MLVPVPCSSYFWYGTWKYTPRKLLLTSVSTGSAVVGARVRGGDYCNPVQSDDPICFPTARRLPSLLGLISRPSLHTSAATALLLAPPHPPKLNVVGSRPVGLVSVLVLVSETAMPRSIRVPISPRASKILEKQDWNETNPRGENTLI
jgi:hypothetical protein